MLLEVDNVSCSVPGRKLFAELSLSVDRGESLAIIGASGIGKSTLISAIMGARSIDSGDIRILGKSICRASKKEKLRLRREHIGFVHQDAQLIEELNAQENVTLALSLQENPPKNSYELAAKALRDAGVPVDTLVSKLSGGERQRTALVRALITKPDIILADEPTGSLDEATRDKMADLLFEMTSVHNIGLVVVTHDLQVANRADRVVKISDYSVS